MAAEDVNAPLPESTIDRSSATTELWDAIVVGGGLAGAIAAREMARAGYRTLLVERSHYPRPKVCGCCLSSLAITTLESIGLGHLLDNCGARSLKEVRLYARSNPTVIPIHGIRGISRDALDTALVREAVSSGASLLLDTKATPSSDGSVVLRDADGESVAQARLVILGSGLRAHDAETTSRIGGALVGVGAIVPDLAESYPEDVVHMLIDRSGYVGIAPLEDGRLTIACAVRADAIQRLSPKGVVAHIMDRANLGHILPDDVRLTGVPTLRRKRIRVQDGRMLVVGDAAGFVEPITGEGMSWAIATGAAVVGSAAAVLENSADTKSWQRAYGRMMSRRHIRCAFVGACIRRPGMVQAALGASSILPFIRGTILSGLLGRYDRSIKGELA